MLRSLAKFYNDLTRQMERQLAMTRKPKISDLEICLSDFILARLRDGLGLWCETYEPLHLNDRLINRAFLFDGVNFAWITMERGRESSSSLHYQFEHGGKWFTVSLQSRDDSRKPATEDHFKATVSKAVAEFDSLADDEKLARKTGFVSLEIKFDETHNRFDDWVGELGRRLQGTMRRYPAYNGVYADNREFKSVVEPGLDAVQFELPSRITDIEINAALSGYLLGLPLQWGAHRYEPSELLTLHFGIERICILSRRF